MINKNYRFISFEGIEGSGKSTQAKKLYDFLISKNIPTILTREPGGTDTCEKIREILIDEKIEKLDPKTELLLNFASRIEHSEKLIKPSIFENKIVICDRFFDSTFAYQGFGFGIDQNIIEKIKNIAIANLQPDITFLIDIEVDHAFNRIKQRSNNNRYEKLNKNFHIKVRNGFLELAKKNSRIRIIDGNKNSDLVFQDIINQLQNYEKKK
jgi:dTMP kinase